MIGLFKKEGCCLICENVSLKPGDLIKCRGICQNSFHLECIKLEESANNDAWKCEECTTGNKEAFFGLRGYPFLKIYCHQSSVFLANVMNNVRYTTFSELLKTL